MSPPCSLTYQKYSRRSFQFRTVMPQPSLTHPVGKLQYTCYMGEIQRAKLPLKTTEPKDNFRRHIDWSGFIWHNAPYDTKQKTQNHTAPEMARRKIVSGKLDH